MGKTIFVTREVLAVIEPAAAETASEKISQGSNPARSTSRYSVPVCLGPLLTWNTIPKRTPYRLINNTGLIRIQKSPINDPVYARLKSSTVKIRSSGGSKSIIGDSLCRLSADPGPAEDRPPERTLGTRSCGPAKWL